MDKIKFNSNAAQQVAEWIDGLGYDYKFINGCKCAIYKYEGIENKNFQPCFNSIKKWINDAGFGNQFILKYSDDMSCFYVIGDFYEDFETSGFDDMMDVKNCMQSQSLMTELLHKAKREKEKAGEGYLVTNLYLATLIAENNEFVPERHADFEVVILPPHSPSIRRIGVWRDGDIYVDENMRWDDTSIFVVDSLEIEDYSILSEVKCKIKK